MSSFMKGFAQSFHPHAVNIGDLISRTMMYDKLRDKNFYNDLALQTNKQTHQEKLLREKLKAEQAEITAQRKQNLGYQATVNDLLNEYDEAKYSGLPDAWQNKYNRIIKNRGVEVFEGEEFIDAPNVPGLERMKGYKVKRSWETKNGETTKETYGKPFKAEDMDRPNVNNDEQLSKVERGILESIEKQRISFEADLGVAQSYGAVETVDDDGEKDWLNEDEVREKYKAAQGRSIEAIKNTLGLGKLDVYRDAFDKYRRVGWGKNAIIYSVEQMRDTETEESKERFADYVDAIYLGAKEKYKEGELSKAEYELYDKLLELDTGFTFKDAEREMEYARQKGD